MRVKCNWKITLQAVEEVWRKERDAWHRQKEDLKVLAPHQIYKSLFKKKSHHFFSLNLRPPLMLKISFFISLKHPQMQDL
jgi:hypothetical protein